MRVNIQPEQLKRNPSAVPNRHQQLLLQHLRVATKGLEGEERLKEMQKLQGEVNNSISKVITELQLDLQYRPQTFFGIVMYPDYIMNTLVSVGGIAIAYGRSRIVGGD